MRPPRRARPPAQKLEVVWIGRPHFAGSFASVRIVGDLGHIENLNLLHGVMHWLGFSSELPTSPSDRLR